MSEIGVEQPVIFLPNELSLVERCPFGAKPLNGRRIEICFSGMLYHWRKALTSRLHLVVQAIDKANRKPQRPRPAKTIPRPPLGSAAEFLGY
jgi:hypothetical protein